MGKITGITWTDHTWNPWRGCHKVSQGCKNCYMFRDQTMYGHDPEVVIRAAKGTFEAPLKWKEPAMVFTCSWSDWCIDEAIPWREEAWDIIRRTPHLTYQILTKRANKLANCLPADWKGGYPNVWLGVSVENNQTLGRIEHLNRIPAKVHFVSYEPALEYVNFKPYAPMFQWLILGGESGPNYRKIEPETLQTVLTEMQQLGVTCFVKQLGGWPNKQAIPEEWPEALRVQEFPKGRL